MTVITIRFTGTLSPDGVGANSPNGNQTFEPGKPVDPFDFEEVLQSLQSGDKIVVIGEPDDDAKKALAGLAEDGHDIEYIA
ncbi:hypothetical protein [Rugamonas apoptosis]|uniref:Uncharacterized protein n=1 Tax=Rugamonas apoptosis TaxID=2758570 RepID=A0A7W2FCM7_9BURK|nr:hypothetical protein [Rugamonas apoptosis]MBA5689159.1 hypothetical protein [Rugamonas apoptosis]